VVEEPHFVTIEELSFKRVVAIFDALGERHLSTWSWSSMSLSQRGQFDAAFGDNVYVAFLCYSTHECIYIPCVVLVGEGLSLRSL
jgi:hypothetical protein